MKTGAKIINDFLGRDIELPGVYKFLNKQKEIIYIGKAKNLRNRLTSYLRNDDKKVITILNQLYEIEIEKTKNEYEALILENSLIKHFKPKYNILLKDDKSFPYILIDESHSFPKLIKYRGDNYKDQILYGPFTNVKELNASIETLQKLFLLRSCSDSFFKNRKTPCILYQIKQCSAPCVNKISYAQYQGLLVQCKLFLGGRNKVLYKKLYEMMDSASKKQHYEAAAKYRDRIQLLSSTMAKQNNLMKDVVDSDVICLEYCLDKVMISIAFIRLGKITGYQVIMVDVFDGLSEILQIFISRFYIKNLMPAQIIIDKLLSKSQEEFLEKFLKKLNKKTVKIVSPVIGDKKKILSDCKFWLQNKVMQKLKILKNHQKYIFGLKDLLGVNADLNRIEIFDNSHCFGSDAVGAVVVCDTRGFNKSSYRKYNFDRDIGKDDYLMLREVLKRRFGEVRSHDLPNLLIVDGGKVHLKIAVDFFQRHSINGVYVISVAKGRDRNSGNETIYTQNNEAILLDKTNKLKQYIQLLRDEAHNFAISSYRKRSLSKINDSVLDDIPGIGKAKKKKLLTFFGSVTNLKNASLEEIENVVGIDSKTSKVIYQYLNKR